MDLAVALWPSTQISSWKYSSAAIKAGFNALSKPTLSLLKLSVQKSVTEEIHNTMIQRCNREYIDIVDRD